jgi:hypothetical protein
MVPGTQHATSNGDALWFWLLLLVVDRSVHGSVCSFEKCAPDRHYCTSTLRLGRNVSNLDFSQSIQPRMISIVVPVSALNSSRHQNSVNECLRLPLLLSSFLGSSRLEILQHNPIILLRNIGFPSMIMPLWYYYSRNSTVCSFLPDFTEHPKPKRRNPATVQDKLPLADDGNNKSPPPLSPTFKDEDITFFHDLVSGGVAG